MKSKPIMFIQPAMVVISLQEQDLGLGEPAVVPIGS